MIFSLNEIMDVLKKAAVGRGLPVGLAEDAAHAGVWLIGQGHDGVSAVLMAIEDGFNGPAIKIGAGHTQIFLEGRVAVCGPSCIELLAGVALVKEVRLFNVDSPFLLIGQAGIGFQNFNIELTLRFSDGAMASISDRGLTLCGSLPLRGTNVLVTCYQSNQTTSIANPRTNGIEIEPKIWQAITALAAKTYVPSSEISRTKGAGAGQIDNN